MIQFLCFLSHRYGTNKLWRQSKQNFSLNSLLILLRYPNGDFHLSLYQSFMNQVWDEMTTCVFILISKHLFFSFHAHKTTATATIMTSHFSRERKSPQIVRCITLSVGIDLPLRDGRNNSWTRRREFVITVIIIFIIIIFITMIIIVLICIYCFYFIFFTFFTHIIIYMCASYRRLIDLLEEYDFDVIALQDITGRQLDQLMTEQYFTNRSFGCYDHHHDLQLEVQEKSDVPSPSTDKEAYLPIIFNKDKFTLEESGHFWFSRQPALPYTKSWQMVRPRACTWCKLTFKGDTNLSFYVFNAHLDQSKLSQLPSVEMIREVSSFHCFTLFYIITSPLSLATNIHTLIHSMFINSTLTTL